MIEFKEYSKRKKLIKFSDHKLGTLFFTSYNPGETQILVRKFDRELSPDYVHSFVDCFKQCKRFIDFDQILSNLITHEEILEVGNDFVVRKYSGISTPIQSYYDEYEPIPAPPQWGKVKLRFEELNKLQYNYKDQKIIKILYASLVKENFTSYFHDDLEKFIITEPNFLIEDIINWN